MRSWLALSAGTFLVTDREQTFDVRSRYQILEGISTDDLDTYSAHKQERLCQGSLFCPCLTCERVRAEMEKS